jgi:hypothetical protein
MKCCSMNHARRAVRCRCWPRDFDAPSQVSLSEDGSGNPVLYLGSDLDRVVWRGPCPGAGRVACRGHQPQPGPVLHQPVRKNRTTSRTSLAFSRLFGSEPSKEEREARAERQVRLSKVGEKSRSPSRRTSYRGPGRCGPPRAERGQDGLSALRGTGSGSRETAR